MKLLDHIEVPYNESDRDITTTCLWCGSEDKLSMSKDEGHVFSCWKCKQAGNALSYMREWYAQLPDLTMPQAKQFIQLKPGVSPSVLRSEGIKFDGGYFWFPVRNTKKDIIALHKYNPSDNIVYSSPKPWNASVLGLWSLKGCDTLMVTEGHWDYLCLKGYYSSDDYDIVGTCGSGFATSYLHILENKHVVLLFDNDDAGKSGVQSVARRIKSSGHSVASLRYLEWDKVSIPSHAVVPAKFDIRDLHNTFRRH